MSGIVPFDKGVLHGSRNQRVRRRDDDDLEIELSPQDLVELSQPLADAKPDTRAAQARRSSRVRPFGVAGVVAVAAFIAVLSMDRPPTTQHPADVIAADSVPITTPFVERGVVAKERAEPPTVTSRAETRARAKRTQQRKDVDQ